MIFGFILLILVFVFLFNTKKKTIPIKDKEFIHLLESEKVIVNALLKSKDHIMWQKELQIAVGFTKSKLSRTIRNMEQRSLVKKTPYGSTNKIELISKKESELDKKPVL